MAPRTTGKPARRRKKQSRTEVSSDSESEREARDTNKQVSNEGSSSPAADNAASNTASKGPNDAAISTAFTKFYMQRAATEFSEDLDRLRGADDFKDDALPLLINALQQGTSLFSPEEQRRIVMAGKENI